MAQLPSNAGSLIGQRLDEYELVALLALGGTAEIYLARHSGVAGFEKYVVVKCLHDHLADDADFVKMFLDEARLGARLDHSNIVQTLELGSQEGRYYMAMEYLAGMSMSFVVRKAAERVPGGRLPLDLSLNLVAQACAGLHYAHNRRDADGNPLNMVHRDVSPQNLVIAFEGVLKVVDFGIAKATVRDTRTQSGTIKGKFAYMSPEQCLAGDIDHRTDVFALGTITHELLTGKRLFKRESTYDTYHAILDCNVPPPSSVNSDLDPALDEVVLKALTKDREDRYPSADAFGDALAAVLHKHGKTVSHGAVARFFEEYFSTEIEEHGQRMRALISGRKATVDEHWGDDDGASGKPDGDAESAGRAEPSDDAPGMRDGAMITSELSISDAELAMDIGEDEGGGGEATRIELNPLERVQDLHVKLTGQVPALGRPESLLAGPAARLRPGIRRGPPNRMAPGPAVTKRRRRLRPARCARCRELVQRSRCRCPGPRSRPWHRKPRVPRIPRMRRCRCRCRGPRSRLAGPKCRCPVPRSRPWRRVPRMPRVPRVRRCRCRCLGPRNRPDLRIRGRRRRSPDPASRLQRPRNRMAIPFAMPMPSPVEAVGRSPSQSMRAATEDSLSPLDTAKRAAAEKRTLIGTPANLEAMKKAMGIGPPPAAEGSAPVKAEAEAGSEPSPIAAPSGDAAGHGVESERAMDAAAAAAGERSETAEDSEEPDIDEDAETLIADDGQAAGGGCSGSRHERSRYSHRR